MVSNIISFQTVVDLCVKNYVDFEVWNGRTTHKELSVRRQMLINPVGKPSIFVTFGDVRHGELVSHISISGNKMLEVTKDELWDTISEPVETRNWTASELGTGVSSETNFTVLDKNKRTVLVTGRVDDFIRTDEDGKNVYNFTLQTPYTVGATNEFILSETSLILKSDVELSENKKLVSEGTYSYPHSVII